MSAMSSECVICMLVVCQEDFGNVLGVPKESGICQVYVMKVLGICQQWFRNVLEMCQECILHGS